jgi:small subunit ribosomal protein S20
MRQAVVHAAQNRTQRSRLRTALKKVRSAAAADVEKAYAEAVQLLDRAGRKRLIHPNAAARQKSRLAKLKAKVKGAYSPEGPESRKGPVMTGPFIV